MSQRLNALSALQVWIFNTVWFSVVVQISCCPATKGQIDFPAQTQWRDNKQHNDGKWIVNVDVEFLCFCYRYSILHPVTVTQSTIYSKDYFKLPHIDQLSELLNVQKFYRFVNLGLSINHFACLINCPSAFYSCRTLYPWHWLNHNCWYTEEFKSKADEKLDKIMSH